MEGLSMNNTLTRARNESRIKPLPIIIVIAALALLVVLNVVVDGKFLTFQNFTIILSAATVPAFVAWGFSYLFACGITDLSAAPSLFWLPQPPPLWAMRSAMSPCSLPLYWSACSAWPSI